MNMYEAKCLVMDYQNNNHNTATQHLHQLHSLAPDTTSARWTQYQQLWRQHHMFINNTISNGKSNCKESSDKNKDDSELWSTVEAQAAFLGPNIWDKTLPYDSDLKYVDLDEFLSDNGIPVDGNTQTSNNNTNTTTLQNVVAHPPVTGRLSPCGSSQQSVMTKRERSPSPSEPMSPLTISPPSPADSTLSFTSSTRDFDPRSRQFSDEELKPQPMFVPDGLKDEKYWARRRKNNMAAKRSRDARRMKENQIALRAGFLEKENMGLRQEMERLKKENLTLRDKLSKFTDLLS